MKETLWTGGELLWVEGRTFVDEIDNADGKTFSKFELRKGLQAHVARTPYASAWDVIMNNPKMTGTVIFEVSAQPCGPSTTTMTLALWTIPVSHQNTTPETTVQQVYPLARCVWAEYVTTSGQHVVSVGAPI